MIPLFSVFSLQFSVPVKVIPLLHTLFFLQLPAFSFQFQPKWTFCVQLSVSSFGFVICYLLLFVEQITNNKCARHAGRQAGVEQIIFWVIYPSTKCGGNVPYFLMKYLYNACILGMFLHTISSFVRTSIRFIICSTNNKNCQICYVLNRICHLLTIY